MKAACPLHRPRQRRWLPRRRQLRPQIRRSDLLVGVAASPGLAVGEVFQVRRMEIEVREKGGDVDAEPRHLTAALATAQGQGSLH